MLSLAGGHSIKEGHYRPESLTETNVLLGKSMVLVSSSACLVLGKCGE